MLVGRSLLWGSQQTSSRLCSESYEGREIRKMESMPVILGPVLRVSQLIHGEK